MFDKLKLSNTTTAQIEWDMTPDLAFCKFSAKGLRDTLVNTDERICYFFIDNHGDVPKLYLMERGTRYVNILAEIKAPLSMMRECIVNSGSSTSSKDNFSIDAPLRQWLLNEVVNHENSPFLIPTVDEGAEQEDFGAPLPLYKKTALDKDRIILPTEQRTLSEDEMKQTLIQWNFFDKEINPEGGFKNVFADSGDGLTVIDELTGLMWQRSGLDLCSIRQMNHDIEKLNRDSFAGYSDWQMPTAEEAMSLLECQRNNKGLYIAPCFSKEQPFIFVAAKRKPTGYWFVDYKQGKIYWSSGTVPGGFCRLCRKMD